MISMRGTLLPALLAALWLGNTCAAQPPAYGTPASYRLYNPSTMGPRLPGCNRCEPIPCPNPGCSLDNPRGTGMDDPWRPPHVWPQTRYPVIPAYTRPSYGFYETSWRVLPLCNPTPTTAGPVMYPVALQNQPAPTQAPLPRPPVVPPAVQRAPAGTPGANPPVPTLPNATPPAATPPAATPPGTGPAGDRLRGPATAPAGPPRAVDPMQLGPPKAAPTDELQPQPPKATPPATGLKGANQGAVPNSPPQRAAVSNLPPQRAAMLDLQSEEAPEVRVQPF
jgi:hypothetical protein